MHDITNILELAAVSDYDFRRSANPDDPLKHLFSDWVAYYRLKWAIARVLQPQRILEIGVRFGYSAAAFLDACPNATYLGIDVDSEDFGGHKGAIQWARRVTEGSNAEYLIADSQKLDELPGGPYDLIHIDGQQDGAGSIRDLLKALPKGRHILFDGYFWTRTNFQHVSEFLYCHRDVIESYVILPGYAGELLITPRQRQVLGTSGRASTSLDLRSAYTAGYYLADCGGFEEYKRDKGLSLGDWRLRAVADLAELAPIGRALDLGCGRGELSVHLARLGHEVSAVDYSDSAIQLAHAAAQNAETAGALRISFQCGDVNAVDLSGYYDVVVASDLIEHLVPAELDRLYSRIAAHLSPQGLFIIHTFPNAWYYKYGHALRLRQARKLDAYVPLEPRTRYEQLMHINEQSPKVLRHQVQASFPHVLLWFASRELASPFENLKRRFTKSEMRSAEDLFVIASHSPIDPVALSSKLAMPPIALPVELFLDVVEMPSTTSKGCPFSARVRLTNKSTVNLRSQLPNPIHLSYHCYSETQQLVAFEGMRTRIPTVKVGASEEIEMQLAAPSVPGRYLFRITLVQEWVAWFDEPPQNLLVESWLEVA
jgi:2-polyprenyl-3-methyl-5-hydroxy-6-metoxy-1,4-benzoquinol methylase